jgi:RNA polymerase sigma-70 factor (ECF subfamily)
MNISAVPHVSAEETSSASFTVTPSDDETLIQQIVQRNLRALEELYDRYSNGLYAFVRGIVKDGRTAEGIVQDTFLRVWQKAGTYTHTGTPRAWIFRIARNRALDHLRYTKAQPVVAEAEIDTYYDLTDPTADPTMTPTETMVEQHYHRHYLRTALATLPAAQRTCLELAYFQDLNLGEIALLTRTPLNTIKTRFRRGLQQMEQILRSYGYLSATGTGSSRGKAQGVGQFLIAKPKDNR